jgi:hypothetical protein
LLLRNKLLLSEELLLRDKLLLRNNLLPGGGNNWSSDLGLLHGSAGDSLAEVVEASSRPDSSGHRGSGKLLGSDLGRDELLLDGGRGGELDGGHHGSGSWLVPVDNSQGLGGQLGLDVHVGQGLDLLMDILFSGDLDVLVGHDLGGGRGCGSKTN